jgi:hypothetical protein
MHFFLYEILARLVAIYLGIDCYRTIRRALAEGKIRDFNPSLLIWTTWIADREATPIQFWIQIVIQITILISCVVVAIFGWFPSN